MADQIVAEEWRPIIGFERIYEVSDLGRVRSFDRRCGSVRAGKPWSMTKRGRIMRPNNQPNGYLGLMLSNGDRSEKRLVHRIVLEAFVGPRPHGFWAAHNNGIKTDNRLCNLRWDTASNNQADKRKHGTALIGEKARDAKLTEADVRMIRSLPKTTNMQRIAEQLGVTRQTVWHVWYKHSWHHVT